MTIVLAMYQEEDDVRCVSLSALFTCANGCRVLQWIHERSAIDRRRCHKAWKTKTFPMQSYVSDLLTRSSMFVYDDSWPNQNGIDRPTRQQTKMNRPAKQKRKMNRPTRQQSKINHPTRQQSLQNYEIHFKILLDDRNDIYKFWNRPRSISLSVETASLIL